MSGHLAQMLPALTSRDDVAGAVLVFGLVAAELVMLGLKAIESRRRVLQFGGGILSAAGLLGVLMLGVVYLAPCSMQVIGLSGDSVELCPYGERAR